MIDTELPVLAFTVADRCDGCGAQAYSVAQHPEFSDLLFCVHHRKSSRDRLLDEGWTIVDDYVALESLDPQTYSAPV